MMINNSITGKKHRCWNVCHCDTGLILRRLPLQVGRYDEIRGWGTPNGFVTAEQIIDLFRLALEEEYIDMDGKGRGSCLNHDLYAYDPDQGVAVIQARQFYRRAAQHFGATRKTYFLVGRNEVTEEYFRHPVSPHAVRAACKKSTDNTRADVVRAVQRWMWEVTDRQLSVSVRQGDVLLVPEREPKNAVRRGASLTVANSHLIRADEVRLNGNRCYALNPTVVHIKGQHAPVAIEGWASIRVARESDAWDFAVRIGD